MSAVVNPLRSHLKLALIFLAIGVEAVAAGVPADQSPPPPSAPAPAPDGPAKTAAPLEAYAAVGSSIAEDIHLGDLGWSDAQIAAFLDGVRAAAHGKGYSADDSARQLFEEIRRQVKEIEARENAYSAEAFARPGRLAQYLKEVRKRYGLQFTDSGLGYAVRPGQGGPRPRPGDTVVVTCSATLADGTTSVPQLAANHVRARMANLLPGFIEGLQMMTTDSEAVFVLPPALSFGAGRWPEGTEPGTPLIFRITLHEVVSPN